MPLGKKETRQTKATSTTGMTSTAEVPWEVKDILSQHFFQMLITASRTAFADDKNKVYHNLGLIQQGSTVSRIYNTCILTCGDLLLFLRKYVYKRLEKSALITVQGALG